MLIWMKLDYYLLNKISSLSVEGKNVIRKKDPTKDSQPCSPLTIDKVNKSL